MPESTGVVELSEEMEKEFEKMAERKLKKYSKVIDRSDDLDNEKT